MSRIYRLPTLARLFTLTEGQVMQLVESESMYAFDQRSMKTVLFIPTLDTYMSLDGVTVSPKEAVPSTSFEIQETNQVTTVSLSQESTIPVSTFLYSPEGEERLRVGDSVALLLDGARRLHIASVALAKRLSHGMPEDFVTISFSELRRS